MKIAFITSTYFPHMGGAEVFLHNLIQALQSEHQVQATLYVPMNFFRWAKKSKWLARFSYRLCPLPPFLFRFGMLSQPLASRYLSREQQTHQYDVWHATFAWPSGYLLRQMRGVPRVLRCPGEDIQRNDALGYGMARDKKRASKIRETLDAMDALVAMSATTQEAFSVNPEWEKKTRVIPNGIAVALYRAKGTKSEAKRRLGLPADKKCLLTVGRHHAKKGFDIIPAVAQELLLSGEDFVWVVIGKQCTRLLDGTSPEVRARFVALEEQGPEMPPETGHLSYLPSEKITAYYQAADIFVFPSLFESFGIVLVEAMAAALAIVTTNAPGCRDLVFHERNGLVVDCHQGPALAQEISRLLQDETLAERLSGEAWRIAKTQYDLPVVAAKYARLYADLKEEKTRNREEVVCPRG